MSDVPVLTSDQKLAIRDLQFEMQEFDQEVRRVSEVINARKKELEERQAALLTTLYESTQVDRSLYNFDGRSLSFVPVPEPPASPAPAAVGLEQSDPTVN